MIVCSCNRLRDSDVQTAIRAQQCRRVKDVYCALGCDSRCGGCSKSIASLIDANSEHGVHTTGTSEGAQLAHAN